MTTDRVYRDMNWSPEDRARHKAIREQFQRLRPGPVELRAGNEYVGPIPHGLFLEILVAIRDLKRGREAAGLSLEAAANKAGIDAAALEKLEQGIPNENPIETLYRYAHALGKQLTLAILDEPAPAGAV
jgi:DNA-binding XRE family transcriptional regulator